MGAPTSTTLYGEYGPFDLQVARGQIAGHKPLFKFGFSDSVGTSEKTVWDGVGIYSYIPTATVLSVSSSSANDTAAGTGARTMSVQGLDQDYNEVSEIVTLNGQTAVSTTTLFIRVYRAFVLTAGSGETAAGTLYMGVGVVTAGVPATVYAQITIGQNQTLMTPWTVPAGYTAYISHSSCTSGALAGNQFATVRLMQRPLNGVFRVVSKLSFSNGQADFDGTATPIAFAEKTDIEIRAFTSSGTASVGGTFSAIYIKNDIT